MKKMLSIAAVAALATSSFAASDLAGAFKEGKTSGQVRAMYLNNDLSSAANSGNNLDKSAFGLGGKLTYETAPLYGVSAGVGFYTSQDLGTKDNNVGKRNTDMLDENGNSYSLLGQAYLQGQFGKTTVKVGRQQLDTPLAGSDDTRMIPNLFEAALVINTDLPDTTLIGGYVARMAGWDSASDKSARTQFSSMSRSALGGAVEVTDTAALGLASVKTGEIKDQGVAVAAAVYSGIKDLTLQAWDYYAFDVLNAIYLQADYKLALAKDINLALAAQYYSEKSMGKTKDLLNAIGTAVATKTQLDYDVWGLKAALSFDSIGLTPYVAYNSYSKQDGIGITTVNAWGGLPEFTNMEEATLAGSYTNTTLGLNSGANGAKAWKVGADYSLEKLGLGARTISLAYGAFDLQNDKNGNVDSDYKVWDVVYTCNGALVKNLDAKLAYEKVDNKVDAKDQTWLKVIFNYNF